MARAELVRDAQAKGIPLTGKESVPELKALLANAGEPEAQVDAEAEAAAEAVADAKALVDEAKAALDAATAAHTEAVAAHAELIKEPEPELGKHILLEGPGGLARVDAPKGYQGDAPDRQVFIGGQHYEHVADHATGVWIYRAM